MKKASAKSANGKKSRPRLSSASPIWNIRRTRFSEALVLLIRGADISTPLTSSSLGTVLTHGWHSTKPWFCVIVFTCRSAAAPGPINVRLAAVRRLAYEAADAGLLSPELAAGIHRVKGVRKLGSRLGNWLTAGEASALWQLPDGQTFTGKRNRAILAILLGCGLRRCELAKLAMNSLHVVRTAGPLWIWSAKGGTYGLSLCRIG